MSAEGIAEQVQFMNEEYVILVDKDDKAIGKETKLGSMFFFHTQFSFFTSYRYCL